MRTSPLNDGGSIYSSQVWRTFEEWYSNNSRGNSKLNLTADFQKNSEHEASAANEEPLGLALSNSQVQFNKHYESEHLMIGSPKV